MLDVEKGGQCKAAHLFKITTWFCPISILK